MQDRRREETEIAGGARNVERTRERERLASVDRLGAREFLQIALDQAGDTQKNLRAFCRWLLRPIGECFLSGRYGKIDITRIAVGDLRIRFARRRLNIVEITAADWLNKLAVDEILNLRVGFHQSRAPAFARLWRRKRETANIEYRTSKISGGEGGIRTLGALLEHGALAKRCFQPLSHLTKNQLREYREELPVANIDLLSFAAEEM